MYLCYRKDIKASVVDYIIAGVDTIGNSIIFTIALIALHPGPVSPDRTDAPIELLFVYPSSPSSIPISFII